MKKALVLGAGGFIGHHLVSRLKREQYEVIGVDLVKPIYEDSLADQFIIGDLRNLDFVQQIIPSDLDELYQLAADMGGAGYVFSGSHDADIMSNSIQINVNVTKVAVEKEVKKIFYASSACMYPKYNQENPELVNCSESSAYPALPDSEYGWEKLFSERLYMSYHRNYGLEVRIGRFHNIYGPKGAWNNGKEKSPAALCRKIASAKPNDSIEIWGDGEQLRSFLFIDDCLDAVRLLMQSNYTSPINIGSEEMISINGLSRLIQTIAQKEVKHDYISGPIGVRARCSDNRLIEKYLNWTPQISLKEGMRILYNWIEAELNKNENTAKYEAKEKA